MFAALLFAGLVSAAGAAKGDYDAATRARTIASTISALQDAGQASRELDIELGGERRNKCQGGSIDLRLRCSIEIALARCARRPEAERHGCLLIVDVLLTNQLSEDWFVSDSRRYALMRGADDFRAAMAAELRSRYAELALELALSPQYAPDAETDPQSLAASIDAFCVVRAHRSRLAWQRCVAAITFYIGSHSPRH